jgi:hypothetical protein
MTPAGRRMGSRKSRLRVGAWVRGWFSPARRAKETLQAAAFGHHRAIFETLEDRRLLSTLSTTTVSASQTSVVYGTPVTFTAAVSAQSGTIAPTAGSVDFYDTTTTTDLGLGTFSGSTGTTSTWTLATGAKTFNVTAGDTITATYTPGTGFAGSSGTTTQTVTVLAITVAAVASTKTYDGTTSSTATPTITPDLVTTFAGSAGQTGSGDGTGGAARFSDPSGVAVDSAGNVYVADNQNQEIRKISSSGVVTTLAGSAGQLGSSNGTGSAARFDYPSGVAVDSAGNVYVADNQNQEIRKISPSGVVTTLAGSAGQVGSATGTGSAGRFDWPMDVAVDSAGDVYVADRYNYEIREITPSGVVTILAGRYPGSSDGTGSAARLDQPEGVAVDSAGNVYVADTWNDEIRKITPSGVVTTLAGSAGQYGSSDGTGSAARFYWPTGVAVDSAGNIYVADRGNDEVREVSPSGIVTTLAGSGQHGSSDGTGSAAGFYWPTGVAVDSVGNVYVADAGNDEIRLISGDLVAGDAAMFTETYNTNSAGTGLTLTPTGSVNDGNGGDNYAVTFVSHTTGVITPATLRPRPEINYRLWAGVARRDDVIPITVEPGRRDVYRLVLHSGDLNTLPIFSLIERCMNIQPRFCVRGTNECDHDFVAL